MKAVSDALARLKRIWHSLEGAFFLPSLESPDMAFKVDQLNRLRHELVFVTKQIKTLELIDTAIAEARKGEP